MNHPTTSKGDIGVAMVTADLILQGARVLMPVSASSPFDLGVLYNNSFVRVQVKYRTMTNGIIQVKPKRATSKHKYQPNKEYDILAIFCPEAGIAYVNREEGTNVVTLRINPSKNNQSVGVNLFKNNKQFIIAWTLWEQLQKK